MSAYEDLERAVGHGVPCAYRGLPDGTSDTFTQRVRDARTLGHDDPIRVAVAAVMDEHGLTVQEVIREGGTAEPIAPGVGATAMSYVVVVG